MQTAQALLSATHDRLALGAPTLGEALLQAADHAGLHPADARPMVRAVGGARALLLQGNAAYAAVLGAWQAAVGVVA